MTGNSVHQSCEAATCENHATSHDIPADGHKKCRKHVFWSEAIAEQNLSAVFTISPTI